MPTNTIYAKIIQFQKTMKSVDKDGVNPQFRSEYATLDSIQKTIQSDLANCGLGYAQIIEGDNLVTTVFDDAGESIKSTFHLGLIAKMEIIDEMTKENNQQPYGEKKKHHISGKFQEIGSLITYIKRYSLCAILGIIVGGEDDDANSSGGTVAKKTEKKDEVVERMSQEQLQKIRQLKNPADVNKMLNLYSGGKKNGKTYRMKKDYKLAIENHLQNLTK